MTSWTGNPFTTIGSRLAAWWRNGRAARETLGELEGCGSELTRIAGDLSVTPSELRTIAAQGTDAAAPLKRRLELLHLDQAALRRDEPLVMRDLERVCSVCGSKRRCERDLARFPDDAGWHAYCPNAITLDALANGSAEEKRGAGCARSIIGPAA